jgi:hypothetical protein
MHSGEEHFIWAWQQYAMILVFLAVYLYLTVINKLPSMDSFKRFADTINSAGGHIIILVCLTVYAIKITMQLFYHVIGLPDDQFTKAQAIVSMATSFSTGTLVGLPMGALLKTMTGGWNMPKGTDTTSTSSTTTSFTPGADPASSPALPVDPGEAAPVSK